MVSWETILTNVLPKPWGPTIGAGRGGLTVTTKRCCCWFLGRGCSLMSVASFRRLISSAVRLNWFRDCLRVTKTRLRCWLGLQIPLISIQSRIGGRCWTNTSDAWGTGQDSFGSKRQTNTMLGRWSWYYSKPVYSEEYKLVFILKSSML